jgi:hypothetical protein
MPSGGRLNSIDCNTLWYEAVHDLPIAASRCGLTARHSPPFQAGQLFRQDIGGGPEGQRHNGTDHAPVMSSRHAASCLARTVLFQTIRPVVLKGPEPFRIGFSAI